MGYHGQMQQSVIQAIVQQVLQHHSVHVPQPVPVYNQTPYMGMGSMMPYNNFVNLLSPMTWMMGGYGF